MPGMTPQGYERESVQDIIARIKEKLRSRIDPSLDLDPETPEGQLIGIFADELGLVGEAVEAGANAFDPDKAEDFLLVGLAKLTGTAKRAATKSRVTAACNLEAGTVLEASVHFAHVATKPQLRFTPVTDFTAPTTGTHSVVFEAEEPGPIAVGEHTLTVIATPVVGWTSVTNPNDAVPGIPTDSNETLRARREEQLESTGNATIDAIRAKVSKVAGVQAVEVFENDTHWTDENGLPPHSFEVLVFDGPGPIPGAENNEIAQAIWNARAGGVKFHGSDNGVALDSRGVEKTVAFSRVTALPVYVEIDVETTTGDEYVGNAALELHLVTEANKLQRIGTSVKTRRVDSLVYGLAGVVDVTDFRIGTSPSPVGTGNLPVGPRQIAHFDTSRATVSSSS